MNVSLVSLLVLTALAASSVPVVADSIDDVPTGFLKPDTGGLPTNAWSGTSLGTAKRLVASLPEAPGSRALRDLQLRVMVSDLTPPPRDGSSEPTLFRKVERLAAMGEGEGLNETVRSAGASADPDIATTTSHTLMMSGGPASACAIVTRYGLTQSFALWAVGACRAFAGDSAGVVASAPEVRAAEPHLATLLQSAASRQPAAWVPSGPLDVPATVMFDLAGARPPVAALRSNDAPMIRAVVANRSLPVVTRLEAAEHGEASATIEATRLSDLYVRAVREGAGMPAAIARATASSLLTLPAKPEYANVAQEAIRGLLLLGDQRLTQAWTMLAAAVGAIVREAGEEQVARLFAIEVAIANGL